jgi:hypothetical protein
MLADFAAVGDYPQNCRKVSIANGSGGMLGQGFNPGDQIIEYEYADLLTTITGNVWAVPEPGPQMIFDGYIRILILPTTQTVTVSGTKPFDSAPGGRRGSMADMDSTEAPYGDIIALHENHCFIPTVSALDIDTEDLYYNVGGDADLLSHTPFDAVYFPALNQDHVAVTTENRQWFLDEIRLGVTGTELPPAAAVVLHQNFPNPFNPVTTIRFDLPRSTRVKLSVYNVKGELLSTLVDGWIDKGRTEIAWNAEDGRGRRVSSGVYFYRLSAGEIVRTRKMILLR